MTNFEYELEFRYRCVYKIINCPFIGSVKTVAKNSSFILIVTTFHYIIGLHNERITNTHEEDEYETLAVYT